MIKFILMDIEGTTTSIDFVHKTLFPYASKHLAAFLQENLSDPDVAEQITSVKQTVLEESGQTIADPEAIQSLLTWIKEDRKHTALKALQGYLWKRGYEKGEYQGHLYEDVLPNLLKWKAAGKKLGIYSSGSVEAQKLLFGYSEKGDITGHLSAYFDTTTGHKRATTSYQKIAASLSLEAKEILFLSDVEQELDAAKAAGMRTTQLVRPGTHPSSGHPVVETFNELKI